MGIVNGQTLGAEVVMLHAVAVLKLRAVVHGDGLECTLRELLDGLVQRLDGLRAGLCIGTDDDFKSRFAFGQCEY